MLVRTAETFEVGLYRYVVATHVLSNSRANYKLDTSVKLILSVGRSPSLCCKVGTELI